MFYSKELYWQLFFFSQKISCKPLNSSPLFWRFKGKLTAHIIITLGGFFSPLCHLLTHWAYPFINLFFLLEIWHFSHQASPYHYLQFCYLDLFSVRGTCASQICENLWDISTDLAVDCERASLRERTQYRPWRTKAWCDLFHSYSLCGRMESERIGGQFITFYKEFHSTVVTAFFHKALF